jgi:hypothetical protein
MQPLPYDGAGYPITATLMDEGARWSMLPGPVAIVALVRILQGGGTTPSPGDTALDLAEALAGDDVVFTLVRDGDHRLSRPQDVERLHAAVAELVGNPSAA